MKRVAVALIRFYQRTLSRITPPTCRFHPTCSEYAAQAIETHGLLRGGWLAARRICRCHPWSEGGDDPVPGTEPLDTQNPAPDEGDKNGDNDA